VDRITGRYSTNEAADWRKVEDLLRRTYRLVLEPPNQEGANIS
jgi:hypothetical protein